MNVKNNNATDAKHKSSQKQNQENHQLPSRVGLYELIKTIGKGNFGVVKLAQHVITKHKVSLILSIFHHLSSPGLRWQLK